MSVRTDATPPLAFRACIVAPTYNNARTLRDVLDRAAALGLPILAVNDGATDGTAAILDAWRAAGPDRHVATHEINRGKGAALRTGFDFARSLGHSHAATLDTDGQVEPEWLVPLLDSARAQPHALVLGARDDRTPGYPAKSLVGRRFSNLAIRIESGARIIDSQCGLRVYPLGLVAAVPCRAGRFGYEAEIITRAAWAGCPIVQVPVPCRYLPEDQRISHYRPVVDGIRGTRVHLRLLARRLLPIPHPRWPDARSAMPAWRRLVRWISPVAAWNELRAEPAARGAYAVAIGVGAFIANLPIYPFQTATCLYVASRWKLHPLAVVAGSQISNPPLSAGLIAAGVTVGHMILHGRWYPVRDLDFSREGLAQALPDILVDWIVGSLVVGVACAALLFALSLLVLRAIPPRASADEPRDP
ncbi:MAG: DUF2062 domain-containing protein [Phycisphaerae bacterium]|nr:DUF2062 domain-containing protein [Phycisphaerae bacterium]